MKMADRSPLARFMGSPEDTDRASIIGCGVVWLITLALTVAALVALAGMGSPERPEVEASGDGGSTWWLWLIIGVSAVIIAGAIPLLVRARRAAEAEPARVAVSRPVLRKAVDRDPSESAEPTAKKSPVAPEVLDRILLRGLLAVLTPTGAALGAVALSALLMARSYDTAAWIFLGVAGAITVAMVIVPQLFVKELKAEVASGREEFADA